MFSQGGDAQIISGQLLCLKIKKGGAAEHE